MEMIFKDEHRPFVETFEVVSDGRVLASGVRPDLKAYIESLGTQVAAMNRFCGLLAGAWFYGAWKAETSAEREMQQILEKAGWWPFDNEDQLVAAIAAAEGSAK